MSVEWLPEPVVKAAEEAFGNFVEKLTRLDPSVLKEGEGGDKAEEPKSYFIDPDMLADDYGMGHRNAPSRLSYDALRQAGTRVEIIASIILLRKNQVAAFCRPQPNQYSVGYAVKPRWGRAGRLTLTKSEQERKTYIERYLLNTGIERNLQRGSLENFVKKVIPDRFCFDQTCFEKVRTRGGDPHSFIAVDGATIRVAKPKNRKGTPPTPEEQRHRIEYVSWINGRRGKEYTGDELAFLVANPTTDVRSYGYGTSEVEILIQTITWLLWALSYNAKGFSQGTTAKGILNIKGRIPPQRMEELRKSWYLQLTGVAQAWKTPIVNSDQVQWIPFTQTNKEMEYQLWLEFLVKCACAVFLCDPAEINHDLRGSVAQQPLFMSSNEAQQKVSKDRGLQPLLRFLADGLNNHVVWEIDDRFEMEFVGLDAKSEDQVADLRTKQVASTHTLNEARALDGLPPIKHGDIPLNPVFMSYVQLQQAAAAGPADGGKPEAGPDGQPVAEHEEDRMFADEEHGQAEHQGAARLQQFAAKKDDPIAEMAEAEPGLFREDWANSVHSSLRSGDLRKSSDRQEKKRFLLVDLD